jgi:hypothetical protein
LNPVNPINGGGPAAVAAGLTSSPVIPFRPWNIFGNLFNGPTPAQAAILQDVTTPGNITSDIILRVNSHNSAAA